MENNVKVIKKLFEKAKQYDEYSEWEFIQAIMMGNYVDNMYELDDVLDNDKLLEKICKDKLYDKFILQESREFLGLLEFISDNLEPSKKTARIMLMLYCHITEMNELYNVIVNLLWIINGFRFYPNPLDVKILKTNLSISEYDSLKIKANEKSIIKPISKVKLIQILSEKVELQEIGKLFTYLVDNSIRNSFYHSSYIFNINKFVSFDLNGKYKIYKTKEVFKKINKIKELLEYLIQLIYESKYSYQTAVTIRGRKVNYPANNIENKSEEKIVNCTICAKEGYGIVSTMQSFPGNKSESNGQDFDNDEFMKTFIEFCSNPDNYKE